VYKKGIDFDALKVVDFDALKVVVKGIEDFLLEADFPALLPPLEAEIPRARVRLLMLEALEAIQSMRIPEIRLRLKKDSSLEDYETEALHTQLKQLRGKEIGTMSFLALGGELAAGVGLASGAELYSHYYPYRDV